jgi:hypothetical protein
MKVEIRKIENGFIETSMLFADKRRAVVRSMPCDFWNDVHLFIGRQFGIPYAQDLPQAVISERIKSIIKKIADVTGGGYEKK